MNSFSLLISLSGLSQQEAAEFLSVSPSSIDKMSRGVRSTPTGILNELRELIAKQERAASEAIALIEKANPPEVELGYPADDYEAQLLGWPCVGAWAAMAGRVIAQVDVPAVLVPRGTTVATAQAADEHKI